MTVIGGLGQAAATVVDTDEVLVRIFGRPTGPDRQRGVELPLDFPDVEADAERGTCKRGSEADCQGKFRPAPELVY
ncbi:hypothetical protein D3C85_1567340 [compost metagenome]